LRLEGCQADCGLTDMTVEQAVAAGAKTLVIGVANRGGVIADNWIEVLQTALEQGLDLAAGLHNRLADVPVLADKAQSLGRQLHDVRHPTETFPVGSGLPRKGKRVLPVGTDCSCGKMYTSLALEKAMRARSLDCDFRATGQTGILICGSGVSVDAVVSDFISGATEVLAPEAATDDHWDIVEGQGSLYHPSFAGVTTGLIHGAQPDYLVLCHEPTRKHMRGLPHYPIPDIKACMEANLATARLTSPDVKFAGISVNTAALTEAEADACIKELEATHGLPTVDPFRTGVDRLVDALL
jgi:uncharacterized NAD-dependent epimerase/dehydratase family protein